MNDDLFTASQVAQLTLIVKEAVREEMADGGLRLDGDHLDQAREDFRFLRKLRSGVDGIASKVGWVVIAAVLGGITWIVQLGLSAWKALP